jgi:hypothetical protein
MGIGDFLQAQHVGTDADAAGDAHREVSCHGRPR